MSKKLIKIKKHKNTLKNIYGQLSPPIKHGQQYISFAIGHKY